MPTTRPGGAAVRRFVCICSLATSLALPGALPRALAQEAPSLTAGGSAWVANAGGDNVLLRENASYDAPVIAAYPEGTPLTIGAGPNAAADGSLWYQVSIGDASGFMDAAYLSPTWTAPAAGTLAAAQPAPGSDAAPAANAAAPAAPAPAASTDGTTTTAAAVLRASPSTDAAALGSVPAGAALAPTGEANDGFIGATYAGQTGWIDAAYVKLGETPAPATNSAAMAQPAPAAAPAAEPAAAPAAEAAPAPPAAAPESASDGLIGDPNAAPAG
ncbi:MAG TPA: SH3 domain-containing protein, partial [Thermomicrobiales bacterium]|nr:SH3 domain-containing protein [Thermomicrobiales bacterium]